MGSFKDINVNLYEMYFKDVFNLKNQYEYLRLMYQWEESIMKKFEHGKFNPYSTAYRWMQNGIPNFVFKPQCDKNILESPNLFDVCYNNLKNSLRITNNKKLSNVIYSIIFRSETDVNTPFKWDDSIQLQLERIYNSYECVQVLCTLLIYAQTKKVYTSCDILRLKNEFSYVKSYKKQTITRSFDIFFEGAVEVNMSQISIPSLMPSYREFYKDRSYNTIDASLRGNPNFKLNLLMMDPATPNIENLFNAYTYGDFFSGNLKVIQDSVRFTYDLMKRFPNQVVAKVVSVPMTYSYMQIVRPESPSIIKIDIYTPLSNSDDRFSIIIDDIENKDMFDYYSRAFCKMFQIGTYITKNMIL